MPGYPNRESITPMDFQYDNGVGAVDHQSPFLSHAAKKRNHSVFDSPSKAGFETPNHPKLDEPVGQRFLFSQTPRTLPQTPQAQNNKLWELRTPKSVADSSGGETPNTPAQDSDTATPDTQLAITMGGLSHGDRKSPKKRESLFRRFTSSISSPSKDKVPKEKPYSKKAEYRVMKRRAHKSRTTHGDYDDESESPTKDTIAPQAVPAIGFAAKIPGVLAWVEAHPNLPNVLSYYMQFIVNAALGFFFLWLVYVVYTAVMADIDHEAANKARDIMHEMAICAQEYQRNGCENPVPAVESLCQNWKRCKERDAYKVARASVGARTFAMIFNSFVEEFSYKSMLFTAMILFGSFNLSNWAFGFWREKAQPAHPQHHDYAPVPQTPQRYPSGGYMGGNNGWNTPYATPYGNMNPPMLPHTQSMPALPNAGHDDDRSPTKKAVLRW